MTFTDERVAAEMGRVLLAIYRAGLQLCVKPDAMNGRAEARILAGSGYTRRALPRSTRAAGDSPLAAIYAAVERYNERAGAVVVKLS